MRLIDADAIKEWVENWFIMNRHYHPFAKSNNIPIPELYDILERMPTIDAVPVVRCRECKYSDTFQDGADNDMPLKCLSIRYGGVYPDWYCEHGKRKDDDENGRTETVPVLRKASDRILLIRN